MQTTIRISHTGAGRSTLSVEVRANGRGRWSRWFSFFSRLMGRNVPAARNRAVMYPVLSLCFLALVGLVAPVTVEAQTTLINILTLTPWDYPTYNEAIGASVLVRDETTLTPLTGTVNFSVDNGTAVPGTVNSQGLAYANLGQLSIGNHTVTATFVGNSTYASASTSATIAILDTSVTFVGTQGTTLFTDGTVSDVEGVAVDAQDNLYISDKAANVVKKEDTSGNIKTVPLTGLKNPVGLALDSTGNLYVADTGNNRILKYDASGTQTVVPITGLSGPTYLAYDRVNDILYIVDPGNDRIVSFTPSGGAVATIVTGMTALRGVSVDASGDIFFSDRNAGFMEITQSGNQIPIYAAITEPGGITASVGTYVVLSDAASNSIIRYNADGDPEYQGGQVQINTAANPVIGMASDSTGRVYLALGARVDVLDPGSGRAPDVPVGSGSGGANSSFYLIFEEPKAGASVTAPPLPASTFSGSGAQTCVGTSGTCYIKTTFTPQTAGVNTGSADAAFLLWGKGIGGAAVFSPGLSSQSSSGAASIGGVALDAAGNRYVTDKQSNTVLKITPSGTSTTLPFTGLSAPTQIAVDALGTVFVLDSGNDQIEGMSSGGTQFTAYSIDCDVNLPLPANITAFALDGDSNLVIAGQPCFLSASAKRGPIAKTKPHDQSSSSYLIALVAGGYSAGIGFENTHYLNSSSLTAPATAVAIDAEENVYSVDTAGALNRFGVDGTFKQLATGLSSPIGVEVDPSGTLYVLGSTNTITLIYPNGTGLIQVNGLYTPAGFAFDSFGDILIGDAGDKQLLYLDRTQQNYVFGDVNVGQHETLDGSISNIGNQPFTINGPLPANAEFAQSTNESACVAPSGSTPGSTIAPASNCDLGYTFTPPSDGPFTDFGTLVTSPATLVGSSGGGAIQLSGNGEGGSSAPQPVLTPAMINFGSVNIGSTSTAQTATLQNSGTAALTISSFGFFGSNTSSFSETNTCGASLAAGSICTISITCTPETAGTQTANLGANFPSPTQQQSIALSCAGATAAAPQATLTPSTASFGNVTSGTTNATQTFTLSNGGNASLMISGITLTGMNPSDFADTTACGSTLAPGTSCTIAVTFTPSATGSFSGSLSVADNASGSPQTSSLTGTGTIPPDFTITATPSAQAVSRGGVATYTVSVTSTNGSFTDAVALAAAGLPGGTITFSPVSVTPGSSAAQSTMTIQTTTQQAAGKSGRPQWPFVAPVFAALLLLLPGQRWRSHRIFMNLACIVALVGIAASSVGCGGGFALPAKTYTITVTGSSGSDTHSTTVTLTVQ
ncbi:choice-of-anchor D domain-containing protein [Granulicella sp. L46]|uniref:choice-of-anchor D domain-containing protein n=1 Tax=Granulicella sp. L46 TaxID=1641865 RepID=UPI00131A8DD3|nr:choice-of-anchor D domain-containing protein [Granulicella sp. L46]